MYCKCRASGPEEESNIGPRQALEAARQTLLGKYLDSEVERKKLGTGDHVNVISK